jgi:3-keto-5-aminohexanoate cleavage enzyme
MPSSDKVVITCALTGGFHDKSTNPNLPEQPDEIVAQGRAAWEAGAAVLHIHARDRHGHNTMDIEVYRTLHERLCAETDAIVQLTTGGGLAYTPAERMTTALLSPEMCSLNMGYALFFKEGREFMLSNPRSVIRRFATEMRLRGIRPELEIYNDTMLDEMELLIDAGLLESPICLSFVLGTPSQNGARATWQVLAGLANRIPAGANATVIAMGRAQLPLTTMGLTMGCQVRVGMEDNIRYSKSELVRDNAQLVERTVRIARELGREPASPTEARALLGTRGRPLGAVPAPVVASEEPVTEDLVPAEIPAEAFRP